VRPRFLNDLKIPSVHNVPVSVVVFEGKHFVLDFDFLNEW
jgi:hypothetical protein